MDSRGPNGDGSSPRVRGKRDFSADVINTARIIPASAGQTCDARRQIAGGADHPRECGANTPTGRKARPTRGSSPRVRGKPSLECPWTDRPPDHPRECGANEVVPPCQTVSVGSSPRVRGKREGEPNNSPSVRIIPASAGQTPATPWHGLPTTDHPRECGANAAHANQSDNHAGSSPRVRGKLVRVVDRVAL